MDEGYLTIWEVGEHFAWRDKSNTEKKEILTSSDMVLEFATVLLVEYRSWSFLWYSTFVSPCQFIVLVPTYRMLGVLMVQDSWSQALHFLKLMDNPADALMESCKTLLVCLDGSRMLSGLMNERELRYVVVVTDFGFAHHLLVSYSHSTSQYGILFIFQIAIALQISTSKHEGESMEKWRRLWRQWVPCQGAKQE